MGAEKPTLPTTCFYSNFVDLTSPDNLEDLDQTLVEVLEKIHPGCRIFVYKGAYEKDKNTNELSACSSISGELPESRRYFHVQPILNKYSDKPLATIVMLSPEPIQPHDSFPIITQIYTNQIGHINRGSLDNLTGLLTRHSLQSHVHNIQRTLTQKKRRAKDTELNYALAFLDIDNFKSVNDKYGHLIGDEVLLLITHLMKKTFRDNDLLFRYGGEEFIVILTGCDKEQGGLVLDRFRKAVESFVFPQAKRLTISIGYTVFHKDIHYDTLLGCADKALYYAKENGRNSCYNYEDLVAKNLIKSQEYIEGEIELF
ncbi:MAG: GGDEF domain-containing protein [Gammaproteobacteria bacterium]|nr:GGDEF domain-containing protein [Gammaproteobacteria bacterium]